MSHRRSRNPSQHDWALKQGMMQELLTERTRLKIGSIGSSSGERENRPELAQRAEKLLKMKLRNRKKDP